MKVTRYAFTRVLLFLLAVCFGAGVSASARAAGAAYDCYRQILLDIHDEFNDDFGGADYLEYALYDIDHDGVKELIVLAGTCEADYVRRIYTIVDHEARYIGETFGGHSAIFACPDDGFYNMMAHMGYEYIYKVTYVNPAVFEELISSKELAEDEDYATPGIPIPASFITDYSLLEDASGTV